MEDEDPFTLPARVLDDVLVTPIAARAFTAELQDDPSTGFTLAALIARRPALAETRVAPLAVGHIPQRRELLFEALANESGIPDAR